MKHKDFTAHERDILTNNPNILEVNEHGIKYSPEFKLKAVKENINGKSPLEIFVSSGLSMLGREKAKDCLKRWKKVYKKSGERGLLDSQRGAIIKHLEKLTNEGKIKYLTEEIEYLKAENDFLKKLQAARKGVI
jgi:transposase